MENVTLNHTVLSCNLIALADLVIPENRQRREFTDAELKDLSESMATLGLIHAPVLRDDGITLVAGERRLRAIQMIYKAGKTFKYQGQIIPTGFIPFTKMGELDEYELKEAELSENIHRVDLTWREKNMAIADLHELRLRRNPDHTKADTAREISGQKEITARDKAEVSNALLISRNMHRPDVQKAKSTGEAVKLATKAIEQEFKQELAHRQISLGLKSAHILHKGAFETLMPNVQPFDLLLTDPPYGIGADKVFGDMSDLDHDYDDNHERAMVRYNTLAQMGFQFSKPEAHAYVFLDALYFADIFKMFEAAGWWVWKTPIVWFKGNAGLLPHPEHGPRRTTEFILYAIKGKRRATAVYLDCINEIPSVKEKIYAAQKPVELYQNLIRRSCSPGAVVIDPMCGSGPIFPAAKRESVVAIGMDNNPNAYELSLQRITLED